MTSKINTMAMSSASGTLGKRPARARSETPLDATGVGSESGSDGLWVADTGHYPSIFGPKFQSALRLGKMEAGPLSTMARRPARAIGDV